MLSLLTLTSHHVILGLHPRLLPGESSPPPLCHPPAWAAVTERCRLGAETTDVCFPQLWRLKVLVRTLPGLQTATLFLCPYVEQGQRSSSLLCCSDWCGLVTQACKTLCNPVGCRLPGYSVHRILQARIRGWVGIPFCRGSSRTRDRTCISCIGRQILYNLSHWEALLSAYEVINRITRTPLL